MKRKLLWIIPLMLLVVPLFIFIGGTVVMQLWNWLMPALFGWHPLTFWQALGLLALCRILFGGFGMHGGRSRMRREGRWSSMTPEERERFRQSIRERCGFGPPPAGEAPKP